MSLATCPFSAWMIASSASSCPQNVLHGQIETKRGLLEAQGVRQSLLDVLKVVQRRQFGIVLEELGACHSAEVSVLLVRRHDAVFWRKRFQHRLELGTMGPFVCAQNGEGLADLLVIGELRREFGVRPLAHLFGRHGKPNHFLGRGIIQHASLRFDSNDLSARYALHVTTGLVVSSHAADTVAWRGLLLRSLPTWPSVGLRTKRFTRRPNPPQNKTDAKTAISCSIRGFRRGESWSPPCRVWRIPPRRVHRNWE